MNKLINISIIALFISLLTSCNSGTVFSDAKELPEKGWNKDSIAQFSVHLEKNTDYQILVNVRNRNDYKYQNMWVFVNYQLPDKSIKKDSLEFYLADPRGRWLGSGFGSLHEMHVVFIPKIKLSQSGTYKFSIQHGMRDSLLTGINDVGLEILKVE